MKIRFIKPATNLGYAYTDPDEIDVQKAFGKEMVELGYAIEIDETTPTDFPADFPGRKALEENGFESVKELERIADVESLKELKGIGQKLAEHIVQAYNELKQGQ
jgi:hypothetical protein